LVVRCSQAADDPKDGTHPPGPAAKFPNRTEQRKTGENPNTLKKKPNKNKTKKTQQRQSPNCGTIVPDAKSGN